GTNSMGLRNLRAAQVGERCVIYHTGDERRAVGLATVERTAYADPKLSDPKIVVSDVRADERLGRPVGLDQLKRDPRFADSPLVRIGRLSVVPLTAEQFAAILELGS